MIILKINSCSDCTCVQISSLVMSGYMQSDCKLQVHIRGCCLLDMKLI